MIIDSQYLTQGINFIRRFLPIKLFIVFGLILASITAISSCSRKVGGKDEVILWHWLTDRDFALDQLVRQYEKETGVKIRLELYAPSDAYASKIRASAQTNTLPDIFGVLGESRDFASFINSGHVANLEPAMQEGTSTWKNEFFPKALANTTFLPNNQYKVVPGIYGVPIDVTNIQMLYNKDLFAQAGLDPEKPPVTWDELLSAWQKLKAAGLPGFVSGWGETWLIDCFANNYAFNIMGERKVLDTYQGKVPYTDPDWIRVFGIFEAMRNQNMLVSGVVTMINKTAEQTFANGKASMSFNGSWCVNVYRGMNPDLHFGAMLPPKVSMGNPMRIWGGAGSSFVVNNNSTKKDKAIAFLRWLTAPAQQTFLAKETNNLPANRKSAGSLPPVLASFAKQMDSTTHPSQWPNSEVPVVTEALTKGIQSILIGEKTPAQVGAEVQRLKERQR